VAVSEKQADGIHQKDKRRAQFPEIDIGKVAPQPLLPVVSIVAAIHEPKEIPAMNQIRRQQD